MRESKDQKSLGWLLSGLLTNRTSAIIVTLRTVSWWDNWVLERVHRLPHIVRTTLGLVNTYFKVSFL